MDDRDTWSRIEALFDEAWELPPEQREAWLRRQPVAPLLIDQVLTLLTSALASEGFLEAPVTEQPDADRPLLSPGDRAGSWRIGRAVGRGGMGEVYEAQRDDGLFEQRGALKLIAGADARDWLRFDAERQILASLEHPGIARLIDGGLLSSERPFMVMEFVDGVPIDVHCERERLSLRERVALVRQVGAALAHAHGRLVVHSDLKPSNILVDVTGRPRLIDFGIAHLVEGGGGQRQARLSPDYAAPEQLRDDAVTTATDVYGLAAVLYRLVAGVPVRRTGGLPLAVVLSRIADAVPLPVSCAGEVSGTRSGSERALLKDLDAILLKALAVDPFGRYRSVEAFDKDLSLALERRPVTVRIGEPGYVARRWLRRNLWPVLATAVVVVSLAVGLGVALQQEREASRQRDEALRDRSRLEAIQQTVFLMFRSAGETRGAGATASDVLDAAAQRIQDEFARDPAAGAPTLHVLGELYFLLNDYEAAAPLLRRIALADPSVVDPTLIAGASFDLAQAELRLGNADSARALLEQAQAFWRTDPARWHSRMVDSRLAEAQLLRDAGRAEEAVELLRNALAERIAISGPLHRETAVFYNNLGVQHFALGQLDPARQAFAAARRIWSENGLDQSPGALNTLNNWGAVEVAAGDLESAEPLLRDAVDLRRRFFGASAATAALLNNYGKLLLRLGRANEAIAVLEDASDQGQRYAGSGSLLHVAALSGLAEAQLGTKRNVQAQANAETALQTALDHLGRDHPGTAMAGIALARVRAEQGEPAKADELLAEADRIVELSGPAGARIAAQVREVRERYRLPVDRPVPGTTRLSP